MVLQRGKKVRVYGSGQDGERVTVSFKGQTRTTVTKAGDWELFLDPMTADTSGATMVLNGLHGETRLSHIVVGDVWVLGGQSNMYRNFNAYPPLYETMQSMNQPLIRYFFVEPKKLTDNDNPKSTFSTRNDWNWYPAVFGNHDAGGNPVRGMSPAGFFFARHIVEDKKIPVGLISASLGSTSIEPWTPRHALEGDPKLQAALDKTHTSKLYNGVVYPITRFAIKGILWYQGESNAKWNAENYRHIFPAIINGWRKDFGQGDIPFIFAQLASYDRLGWDRVGYSWAILRESQAAALKLPNTGMITLIDAGDEADIHPASKDIAGYRFYMKAREVAYGEKVISSGPVFQSAKVIGSEVHLKFSNTGKGLLVKQVSMPAKSTSEGDTAKQEYRRSPGDRLIGFAICGADRSFVEATARIVGKDTVIVTSDTVAKPEAVRYAWKNFSLANLYNQEGFPAEPFRTDSFPLPPPEVIWPALKRMK